jgi:hypothetical protein
LPKHLDRTVLQTEVVQIFNVYEKRLLKMYESWNLDMEIKNKKSILATLDDIIENSKDRIDGRTGEFYVKGGFRLGRNERAEPGMGKQDIPNEPEPA